MTLGRAHFSFCHSKKSALGDRGLTFRKSSSPNPANPQNRGSSSPVLTFAIGVAIGAALAVLAFVVPIPSPLDAPDSESYSHVFRDQSGNLYTVDHNLTLDDCLARLEVLPPATNSCVKE